MSIKNNYVRWAMSALTVYFAMAVAPHALAQGSLTPVGAPAPTMKSLTQIDSHLTEVEPRTPISSLTYVITNAGSYYLTTNLVGQAGKDGIVISNSDVTIDLNGFTLLGVPTSLKGIVVSGLRTNISVRNGMINGWGGNGVDSFSSGTKNLTCERLFVSGNGGSGILAGDGSNIRDCTIERNAGDGIDIFQTGLISGCISKNNGGLGVFANLATVQNCQVQGNGSYGIYYGAIVRDCQVYQNSGSGIVSSGGLVSGCWVGYNVLNGISVTGSRGTILNNLCIANNGSGNSNYASIYIEGNNNRIEGNQVSGSSYAGIRTDPFNALNNVIVRNTVSDCAGNNFMIRAGNDTGPIGTAATSTSPWANISH